MPNQTGQSDRREFADVFTEGYSAYTIGGACHRLGDIGRTTLYGLIGEGKLEAVKLGSRTLITRTSIDALLTALPRFVPKSVPHREGDVR